MILSFKPQFVLPILEDTKIHTIREDKHDRWFAGRTIHAAIGVRTKDYYNFMESKVVSTQKIEIIYPPLMIMRKPMIYIDGLHIHSDKIQQLIINDGFENTSDFYNWFNKDFTGKIIHWTDFKY